MDIDIVFDILFSLFQVSDATNSHYFTLGVGCVGKSRLAFVILVFLWKYFFYQVLVFPLLVNSSSLTCFDIVISSKDVILSCCRSKTLMYIYRCSLLIGPELENTLSCYLSLLCIHSCSALRLYWITSILLFGLFAVFTIRRRQFAGLMCFQWWNNERTKF